MKMAHSVAALGIVLSYTLLGLAAEGEGKKGAPTTSGKVKTINASSITLEGRAREGQVVAEPKTYTLAKDVKVTSGAQAKTLADVQAGAAVTLTLSADSTTVTNIALPGARKKEGEK